MLFFENIKFAFSALKANKVRSSLTMLGVIIGVFSVITLVAMGEGVRAEFSRSVESIGSNLLAVLPVKLDTDSGGLSTGVSFVGISTLKSEDADEIKTIPHVKSVGSLALMGGITKYEGRTLSNALVAGVSAEIGSILDFDLKEGRLISQEDIDQKNRVLVISEGVVTDLFESQSPLGKKLVYFGEEMEIIGVANWTFGTESGADFLEGNVAKTIGMPITTAWEISESRQIHRIVIKVDDPKNVREVQENAKNMLIENHDRNEDFSIMTAEDALDIFDDIFSILTNAITGIAAISLIVGGIGIMNIMLVSVTERTREIGIRKAVGASNLSILFQFLVESATLSLIGGIIGVGLAFLVTNLLSIYIDLPTKITFSTLILAFGIAVGIGIIFGLAPASKAARKNPIDALRYE